MKREASPQLTSREVLVYQLLSGFVAMGESLRCVQPLTQG